MSKAVFWRAIACLLILGLAINLGTGGHPTLGVGLGVAVALFALWARHRGLWHSDSTPDDADVD